MKKRDAGSRRIATMKREYRRLESELIARYPEGITLPPEYAEIIQNNTLSLLIRLARYKFAARMLSPRDRVLDVGCSTGLGTIFLGQCARSVRGVDLHAGDIAWAKRINRRRNVSFASENIFSLVSDKRYDAVVTMDVIEHFTERDGARFAAACARRLKPDGMLILGTPSVHIRDLQNAFSKAAHIRMYTKKELQDLLGKHFRRVQVFSMNDEAVHTGHPRTAWYYLATCFMPKGRRRPKS